MISTMLKRFFYILSYLRRPPWDTGISPPELMDFISQHSPGRALDIGCGTGTNAITLAKHGWEVTGIDFVRRAIRSANAKAQQSGVKPDFRVGDVTQLDDLPGPFDLILDIGCFHSLSRPAKNVYVSNLVNLLAREGSFLIYGFIQELDQGGTGINQQDMIALEQHLELISRRVGTDRGERSSVWMEFKLKNNRYQDVPGKA
jgi:2-polyprenyl-3-methyl-5-hydroxy-6-metoxy-1,4-benzoquinol methylase